MEIVNGLSDKVKNVSAILQNDPMRFLKLVLLLVLVAVVLMLVGYLAEILSQLRHDRGYEKRGVLLEILPKETTKLKDTELLIRNIHAVLLNTKWRKLLYGRPYLSYEIVADQDGIKFYIKVPRDYKDILIERIYTTYSEVAINEVAKDYLPDKVWVSSKDIFLFLYRLITYPFKRIPFKIPKTHLDIAGTEMELAYHHIFKIKTKAEKDILGSIMSSMKNLEWHEKIVVQILARPLDNDWQLKGRKILEGFEKNGIRPMRGISSKKSLKPLFSQFAEEIDVELGKIGMGKGSSGTGKTRSDRKEISVASDKLLEPGFETVIRVMAVGHYRKSSRSRVKGITAGWNELDQENRFKRNIIYNKRLFYIRAKNRRMYLTDRQNILTPSELSNFFLRLPSTELINDFPEIEFLKVKEFAPPKNVETKENIIGKSSYRGEEQLIGIKPKDLVRHVVVEGKTGTGKSEWLKSLLKEHIEDGKGCMLLEPHGKLVDEMLELIPEKRRKDVVYFDLFDPYPPDFNFCKVFKREGTSYEDQLEKTTEEVIEIFAKSFSDAWSSKNEYYVTNAIKTVIELQQGTMLDIQRLFTDKGFRDYAINNISDEQVKAFWKTEFAENKNGSLKPGTEATVLSVMHKLGKFLNSKKLLRSVGQEGCIDFKDILDNNKIVIFRLSKETMSEDRISFLGGIALKLLIVASFARDKKKWNDPFIIAIDEAQNFISPSIETVLDELRKYGISLVVMHQRLAQMDKVPGLINAIYGNVGTSITFAVGEPDAPFFEKIYGPRVDGDDLKNLPSRYGYCKLLVDGETSDTFNIYTIDRPEVDKKTGKKSVIDIKVANRKGRMHYKEIDKMLKDKINNYNRLDEVGEPDQLSFSEELDETHNIVEKIEDYKEAAATAPPFDDPDIDLNLEEYEDEYEYIPNVEEVAYYEEKFAQKDSIKEDIDKIDDVYVHVDDIQDDVEEFNHVEMNNKFVKANKVTLADFLEPETDRIEESIDMDKISSAVVEHLEERNPDEDIINPVNLWNKSKEIEENAIKKANERPEDPGQESAKNLWEMAKLKEKEKKGK